jgi:type I restriction enzyme R subunit
MIFNENSRVKIPAILHLCRLGYSYTSLKDAAWDGATNIFPKIFSESLIRINTDAANLDPKRILDELSLALDGDDLGKAFYDKLAATSGIRLIDFEKPENNSWHVVTELPCINGEDEFRPDITLLVNGMPLVFIEVKKPNNRDGIIAERERIDARFKNKKFKKFINATQLMVFSNNMEYDDEAIDPIQGAFYATTARRKAGFNFFREEERSDPAAFLRGEDDALENAVLRDTNLVTIKHSPEFACNKNPDSPTNRILSSLCRRERLLFLLRYGLAYVREEHGYEKHVMRYPQLFATKAIERKLDEGIRKGIIWHTQGSGKTALAYFNVHYLTDYFRTKNAVPKFYFVVDRIDLMTQASGEFAKRGLTVHTVDSKEALKKSFSERKAIHNHSGKREITVVNIQKFKDDTGVIAAVDYDISVQRIYFLDEVHRSYNPKGSFLANLVASDRSAILIGLTGTPLIDAAYRSTEIFGDYIHKYYYNLSIADGYTLRLIREGIETSYRMQLEQAMKEVEVLKGDADKAVVYAHPRFAEPMLDYIVLDFIRTRIRFADHSIGGMVVCDSADQARMLFSLFIHKYNREQETLEEFPRDVFAAAEPVPEYGPYAERIDRKLSASLILHDVGSKTERRSEIDDFKDGKIDLLFVYNMLLTGFDAKRLKKLYLGRVVKDHNLLQTLTRVNRPYKDFKYGYVVDFADIRNEFDKTNKAYFDELQKDLGDELEHYSHLLITREEIEADIREIKDILFRFDTANAEIFSAQISKIEDRATVLGIKKALENAKFLFNAIRLLGFADLADRLDFRKLSILLAEADNHLALLNQKESLENATDTTNLLNVALENIVFMFRKISEGEMVLADKFKDELRRTREALGGNFDPRDPEFTTLYEELKRLFAKGNMGEVTQEEMKANMAAVRKIHDAIAELNRRNDLLRAKYEHDEKYARVHKRIRERDASKARESEIHETLMDLKQEIDEKVLNNRNLLEAENYFAGMLTPLIIRGFRARHIDLDPDATKFIKDCIVREYLDEFNGRHAS